VSVSILSEGITTVFLFTIEEVPGFQFLTKRAQLFSSQNNGLPRGPRTRNTMPTELPAPCWLKPPSGRDALRDKRSLLSLRNLSGEIQFAEYLREPIDEDAQTLTEMPVARINHMEWIRRRPNPVF